MKRMKEKLAGLTGSVSGIASILGSWQICHNICLVLISALSLLGITLVGMPLAFLTDIAVPIWIVAVIFLALTYYFYFSKKCISKNLLILNLGLIIAGIPFTKLQPYQLYFWLIGGGIATIAMALIFHKNWKKMSCFFKRNTSNIILTIMILIVIIVLIGSVQRTFLTNNTQKEIIKKDSEFKTISLGTTNQGDVAIDLTPVGINGEYFEFKLSLNTHSVDLTKFDLKNSIKLIINKEEFFPIIAPSLQGHHVSGVLKYDIKNQNEDIGDFMIIIKNIPKTQERIFKW